MTDQEPQLLDLGLGRVALGQNSIVLGPQRCQRGILTSDDFRHLPQVLKQPIGISRKVIRHQRHGAILLVTSRKTSLSAQQAVLGRGVAWGCSRCHGKPSSSVASCAALKRTTPSAGEGQQNRPASSLLL